MTDSNDELLNRIIKDEPPTCPKEERLRKAIARWYEGRRNKVMAYLTVTIIATLIPILVGVHLVFSGVNDTRPLIMGIALLTLGLAVNVLMKLWYWIVDSKISVIKELRLVQLGGLATEATEMEGAARPDPEALERLLPEHFFRKQSSFWARIEPKTMRRGVNVVLIVSALAMVPLMKMQMKYIHAFVYPKAGVEQQDEWHVTGGEEIVAQSRLTYCGNPGEKPFLTIALPYGSGQVRRVTVEGKPLSYEKLDWRRYEIQLPIYPFPWEGATTLLIEWSFPMESLLRDDRGFRTVLASFTPVDSYRLDVLLDPDCGYEVSDDPSSQTWNPFNAGRISPPNDSFGSCGIWIRPREN